MTYTAPSGQTSTGAESNRSASAAQTGPLSFILVTDLRRALTDAQGNQYNGLCYSNIISRPGPPAGSFDPRSGQSPTRAIIQSYYPRFLQACRQHGPASEHVSYVENWGAGPLGPEGDAKVRRSYEFEKSRGGIQVNIAP